MKDIDWIDINLDEIDEDIVYTSTQETVVEKTDKKVNLTRRIFAYVIVLAAVVLTSVIISRFVLYNAYIPSGSMKPTIAEGNRLMGNRLAYLFSEPKRGDVIIFEHQCYEDKGKDTLIKRIIGLPGDRIMIVAGRLYINDEPYAEEYIMETMSGDFGPYEVPKDCYFVMGDNRNVSDDSRLWTYRYVKKSEIVAKAWFRYKPSLKQIK